MVEIDISKFKYGSYKIKKGFAKMQKNGVVMDVTNSEQAIIAEESGAVAVMALERVPADIRSQGGVARMVTQPQAKQQPVNPISPFIAIKNETSSAITFTLIRSASMTIWRSVVIPR